MRTVAKLLSDGINAVEDLQESLHLAAQLEFSTIPPYLCAQWSVKADADPGGVATIIQGVVVQEMLHMSLALNMLNAIGGAPTIAQADFIPTYPTNGLPGNVHPGLKVDLLPLGPAALNTFLTIEYPEKGPIAFDATEFYPTIGDFYDAIAKAFETIQPKIDPAAKQVVTNVDADQIFAITSVDLAVKAITEIKDQGEGTSKSPFEGTFDPKEPAHYYSFKEIATGRKLQKDPDGVYRFNGPAIQMPGVYDFKPSSDPTASDAFNVALSDLLRMLQKTWTTDPTYIETAINQMFTLQSTGVALIQGGIQPAFHWSDKSNLS